MAGKDAVHPARASGTTRGKEPPMNLSDSLRRAADKLRHSDPSLAADLLLGAETIEALPPLSQVAITYPQAVADIAHTAERLMGFEADADPASPAEAIIRAGQRVSALGAEVAKLVEQHNALLRLVDILRS